MPNFLQGDIVMVPFSFTEDPKKLKGRTALIVSNNTVNKDGKIIVAYVTSTVKGGKYGIIIPLDKQIQPSLITCEIRTNRLFTADKTIIGNKVCSLDPAFFAGILAQIKSHF